MQDSTKTNLNTPFMRPNNTASPWEHAKILIHYRHLIYSLTMKEVKARYKHSVLGFVWSLLNPLGMMLVFSFVFGFLMRNEQIDKYPLFVLCGLLPWNFFVTTIMTGMQSIVANSGMIKKVYFPREVLPISIVLSSLINFLLGFLILFGALIVFHSQLSPWLWMLPLVMLTQTLFALGLVFFLSTLQVFYRDTAMVMDVAMLAWFFVTPVFYSMDFLPKTKVIFGITLDVHRWLYFLNPMASIISTYRDLLYYGYRTDLDFFLRTFVTALGVLILGYWFFYRHSGRFGEEL